MQSVTFRTQLLMNGITLVLVSLIVFVSTTFANSQQQEVTQATQDPSVALNQQASSDFTTISYQGHLTDADGEPIDDTLPMEFRLYTDPKGGDALWTEERTGTNAVPVKKGLFKVMLGSVEPLSMEVVSQELWLGISVDGDSEMTPREQVGRVPIADTLNQPVMTLLAEKTRSTADESRTTQEDLSGWNPMMGDSVDDPIEVTVETHGGPVFVHMTGTLSSEPDLLKFCAIRILEPIQHIHIAGNRVVTRDFSCSGSYLFSDLPAGTYTFAAYGYVGGTADTLTWTGQRQIAVYEFVSPAGQ